MAASGDEVLRPHGKEYRSDQNVRRRGPASAASVARAEAAQEGQASSARIEGVQENRDEEMTEASITSDAENVKPRIEESREDSIEVSSRMEDGDTPVGG